VDLQAKQNLVAALRKGALPDAQLWEIAEAVQALADQIAAIPRDDARAATEVLNKHRHFAHTRVLGEAWRARQPFDAVIAKHHAQAEIDLLALDAGEALVRDGLKQIAASGAAGPQAAKDTAEFEGLLGRVYKQRYVLSPGDLDQLARATEQYRKQYTSKYNYWHGINVLALLARQEREGVAAAGDEVKPLAQRIVREVLEEMATKGDGDPWAMATLSEAHLALGQCSEAELWLYRLLHHQATRPFHLESYARQLREIWQGDAARASNRCPDVLAGIMARHALRTERRVTLAPADIPGLINNPAALEKNFSGEGTFSVAAIEGLLRACASIGCVQNARGERLGTGFLVSGKAISPRFEDRPVFVTNAHVISREVPNAIAPADARVSFELEVVKLGQPKVYKVKELLYTSPPGNLGDRSPSQENLDVTLVTLEGQDQGFDQLGVTDNLPLVDPKSKAYVIGHPRGAGLQISLNDSVLLDIDDDERLMHYRTPTDPGSSGSPVFNAKWQVIAVHHGGSSTTPRLRGNGSYEANEGITLSALRRKLA
jgi:V8-like Glu-specific endopeptidase